MTPELNHIYVGDSLEIMRSWPASFIQTVVTSPPYFGLRDYGVSGQIGLEPTPEVYVAKLVEVFREVRRVLRDDGTLWINMGDSYTSGGRKTHGTRVGYKQETNAGCLQMQHLRPELPVGLKSKDLLGIPWRMAFALQADGWYLRSDIIWAKPNPMPESVTDRPTKAHEYLFLMTKSERYFYDADAIKEPATESSLKRLAQDVDSQIGSFRANRGAKTNGPMKAVGCKPFGQNPNRRDSGREYKGLPDGQANLRTTRDKQRGHGRRHAGFNDRWDDMEREEQCSGMRNKRSVWTVATMPFAEAHFATFPPALIKPCILAGSTGGGIVLDPFMGAGTTALVAAELGRQFIGVELNPAYAVIAEKRIFNERAQAKMAL